MRPYIFNIDTLVLAELPRRRACVFVDRELSRIHLYNEKWGYVSQDCGTWEPQFHSRVVIPFSGLDTIVRFVKGEKGGA